MCVPTCVHVADPSEGCVLVQQAFTSLFKGITAWKVLKFV